jgi:hydroxymethylpyrimidine/phosphomethylpyrimidine kinase
MDLIILREEAEMPLPVAMTIAGSDSGAGAGLQADLRTFNYMGIFATSVVTAVTAQNSVGVKEMFPLDAGQVRSQLDAVAGDIIPTATKTGMLATASIVREVGIQAASGRMGHLVVDPVLISTAGQELAEEGMARELACELIPLSVLVTPNIQEAEMLSGVKINHVEDAKEAALAMTEMEANAICITGGHFRGDPVDVLFTGDDFIELPGKRIGDPGQRFHGTGCLFSAAATGYLAQGLELTEAVKAAKKLVEKALEHAFQPGQGMPVPWLPASP